MSRRCARPDCHGHASTTLSYDYPEGTVWIDVLADEPHPMTHDLCERHADGLSVPRGWQLRDRRTVVPLPLFGVAAGELNATDRPRVTPRWGLGDAIGGWLVAESVAVVASAALLTGLGYLAPIGQATLDIVGDVTGQTYEARPTPLWLVAVLQAFLWLGLLGAPVLAARAKGNGMVEDFGFRFRLSDLPIGAAIGVASQLVLVPVVSLPWITLLGKDLDQLDDSARELADKATDPLGIGLLVAIVVIGAPIVEELFFRGLLQRSLLRRTGPVLAIALSSFLFGLTHFQMLQFPALVAFGAILGFLAYRTGRLGPGIVAHMAFNTVTVIALLAAA